MLVFKCIITIREQEVQKEFEKKEGQAQKENEIVYMDGKIYVPNNEKI